MQFLVAYYYKSENKYTDIFSCQLDSLECFRKLESQLRKYSHHDGFMDKPMEYLLDSWLMWLALYHSG